MPDLVIRPAVEDDLEVLWDFFRDWRPMNPMERRRWRFRA